VDKLFWRARKIEIGMDVKEERSTTLYIERFWRSLKYDYVYLHPAGDGLELYKGLKKYMHYYNYENASSGN
jgi:putative transposase